MKVRGFPALAALIATTLLSAGCGALHSPVALGLSPVGTCRAALSPAIFPASLSSQPIAPSLRWTAPNNPGHRHALEDWCSAVGPAVVAGAPVALPAAISSPPELVIVSWNVHVGAGDVLGLVEQLRAGHFTDGQPVHRFVLLLQETYRNGDAVPRLAHTRGTAKAIQPHAARRRMDIVEIADALDLSVYYVPSMRNGAATREDRGNAILSTEPLSDLEAIELPFERQRRVAVQATIALSDADGRQQSLRLTNAHLENMGSRWRLGFLSPVARLAQASALMDRVPTQGAAVLAGDLNTWFGSLEPAYRRFARSFDRQRYVDSRPTFSGILRLDHLFVRLPRGWEAETVRLDRFGSDHHPLLARLRTIDTDTAPAAQ